MTISAHPQQIRIDIWLWTTRFFKTRQLSKVAIENGRVLIAGQRLKPSRMVNIGDILFIQRGEEVFSEICVLGISSARVNATLAQQLYQESEASKLLREQQRLQRQAQYNGYQPPESRPDKRARRLIRALGDIDAM